MIYNFFNSIENALQLVLPVVLVIFDQGAARGTIRLTPSRPTSSTDPETTHLHFLSFCCHLRPHFIAEDTLSQEKDKITV